MQGPPITRGNVRANRTPIRKSNVEVSECTKPWTDSMHPYMSRILGHDVRADQTFNLLTTAWAPNTSATYSSTIRRYFEFCDDKRLAPLARSPPATMARFVTWLGNFGTIKASSLYPYLSAVKNFYKDHGRDHAAIVGRSRRASDAKNISNVTRDTHTDAHPRTTPSRSCTPRVSTCEVATRHNKAANYANVHDTISNFYKHVSPPSSYLPLFFRKVAQKLSALFVTSSPHNKWNPHVPSRRKGTTRSRMWKHNVVFHSWEC
jgi:hypothetical protein